MIATIFLIFAGAALLVVFRSIHVRQLEMDVRYEQLYMLTLENIYEHLKAQVEEIRKYRHDLADHIQTLEVLMANKEQNVSIQNYLKEIKLKYKEAVEQKYCSNEIVNALLALRKSECEEKGIELSIQVQDGAYHQIEDKDFIKIIHNLLDNAIEACEKISSGERKMIVFQMQSEKDMYIRVNNSYSRYENMNFQTKKSNAKEHGYGMKIVDDVVKKYSGTWEIQVDDAEYVVRQTICIQDEKLAIR